MSKQDLFDHLKSGQTHVCQCWAVTRTDGKVYGFTDHDRALSFDNITFQADSGLSAKALSSSTGISVNNTEAVGLLQSDVISERDITAGRFDGAEVVNWLVCWKDVSARQIRFRGTIGEISRQAGQFQAELRGLTDKLNQPQGRSYLRTCSAVLGDAKCGFDLADAAYRIDTDVTEVVDVRTLKLTAQTFNDRWFEQGRLQVRTGKAKGLSGAIKHDRKHSGHRIITLWHPIRDLIEPGDEVRLIAGCDRRAETCRVKFDNFINFQGFPDMPGDDWMMAVPRASDDSDGGSLVR